MKWCSGGKVGLHNSMKWCSGGNVGLENNMKWCSGAPIITGRSDASVCIILRTGDDAPPPQTPVKLVLMVLGSLKDQLSEFQLSSKLFFSILLLS